MVKTILAISIIITTGCNQLPNYELKQINLNEEMGNINIPITIEYDTLMTWDDRTDYHCGTKQKKRFANRKFNPIKETQHTINKIPDSVYQVTIVSNPPGCKKTISEKLNTLEFYKKQLEETGAYKFRFQEKITIHDKPAILFGFELGEFNGKRIDVFQEVMGNQNLELYIEHQNQIVTVKFECSGLQCKNYIKLSKDLAKQVKFEK